MRRTSIVRSKRGRGELCADEGKRRVVHHEWRLERGGDSFFDGSTVGRGGYIGDREAEVYSRQEWRKGGEVGGGYAERWNTLGRGVQVN